jgi:hypothetical protein
MLGVLNCKRMGVEKASGVDMGVPVLAVLLLLAAEGCVSVDRLFQRTSARLTGCPEEDVVVTIVQRSGTRVRTWNVACRDQLWACANDWGRLKCVPVEPPPPPPAPPTPEIPPSPAPPK